ncbi:phosphoenolpyruvate synthase [Gottschalkiaceae bacterium SANA]|nr:phosphoenolpyruvate synthase [Gottschalkiaceae bacterium SANA]
MIKHFQELTKEEFHLVGGKGHNLGILLQASFPVPEGFCILSRVFDEMIRKTGGTEALLALDQLDPENVKGIEASGKAIRGLILQSELSEILQVELQTALQRFDEGTSFAVRSSATAEDLPDASFAGQQDSYLFIEGIEAVMVSIRKCWASLFNDRAISYRLKNKISHQSLSISVVVQEMIAPKYSGVVFTVDPLSEDRRSLIVDYVTGTGDDLVAGKITPNTIAYQRKAKEILSHHKESEDNGVLEDQAIHQLAELAVEIEALYEMPMDIEWALDQEDKLWILQARAITTLFPLIDPDREGNAVYLSFHHVQNMMKPIRPLGVDCLKWIFPFDRNEWGKSKIMKAAGGYVFLDITDYLAVPIFRKAVGSRFDGIDALMASSMRRVLKDRAFVKAIQPHNKKGKELLDGVWSLSHEMRKALHPRNMRIEACDAFIASYVDHLKDDLVREADPVKRLESCKAALGGYLQEALMKIGSYIGPGMASYLYLVKKTSRHLGSDELAQLLASGLVGNVTTEMGLVIGDLAEEIRKDDVWLRRLDQWDASVFVSELMRAEGSAGDLMRLVMDRYGSRGIGEIDITNARWFEDPTPIVISIQNHLRVFKPGQHRREYHALTLASIEAGEAIVTQMSRGPRWIFRRHYRNMVDRVLNLMPAREHGKYGLILVYGHVKKEILQAAKEAVDKGWLDTKEDIYYLKLDEIIEMVKNKKAMQERIKERKLAFQKAKGRRVPRVVTNQGWIVPPEESNRVLKENELGGTGVSSGIYQGIARVVEQPEEARMKAGEILVAPFTDPGWTPLFIHAKGLILEVGGLLTHGAIVAREYGIPAVVGVDRATSKIKTGDWVQVDGNTGIVTILQKKEREEGVS